MAVDIQGARVLAPEDLGALPLSDEINHVVGQADEVLFRPAGTRMLFLSVEVDNFRVRVGDLDTGDPGIAGPPSSTVTDGRGSLVITAAMGIVVLSAPTALTVKGSAGGSILTYWWL